MIRLFLGEIWNYLCAGNFYYDVEVYTERQVSETLVKELLAKRKGLVLRPAEDDSEALEVRERGFAGMTKPGLIVGASCELLADFVPRSIASIMDTPAWKVSVSTMEGCDSRLADLMAVIYKAIADEGNGLVFHRASREVLYRSSNVKTAVAGKLDLDVGEKPLIELSWCIPADKVPQEFMPRVMALWNEIEPRLLPLRYGYVEVSRFRASPESMDGFYRYVQASDDSSTYWQSRLPVVGGNFSWACDDKNWKVLPARYARYHSLRCSILSSTLNDDTELMAKVLELFQRTSLLLDAFFASAILLRIEPWEKGCLPQHIIDNYSLQYGPWWQGLPVLPVWLAWYGRAYFPYVKDSLAGFAGATVVEDEHIFLRTAEQPLNLDELKTAFPVLPDELILREIPVAVEGGGVASRRYEPAPFIPAL